MSALAFIEQHPLRGRRIDLTDGATIGRAGCDVFLPDPRASRRHAVLRGRAVEDLGSTNGTFLNERRIDGAVPVRRGDVLRFGNTVWTAIS